MQNFDFIEKGVTIYLHEPNTTHVRRIEDAILECMSDNNLDFIWLSDHALKFFCAVDSEFVMNQFGDFLFLNPIYGITTVSGPLFLDIRNDTKILAVMPFKNGFARLVMREFKLKNERTSTD